MPADLVHRPLSRYRRAEPISCYWGRTELVAYNYETRVRTPAPPLVVEVLDYCSEWRTFDQVHEHFSAFRRRRLGRLLTLLVRRTLLEQGPGSAPPRESRFARWEPWMPEAAMFHFGTRDVSYGTQQELDDQLVRKAATNPPPPPVKEYAAAPRTPLPLPGASDLSAVLGDRRTWRRFGARAVSLEDVATLLGHTWGVQEWAHTRAGRCALKTSPSGGARHPIEAYLLARRISGLAPGCYHYDPDAHELALVKSGLTARRLSTYMASQACYRSAAAVVVMTAVFGRSQWRYEFSRAYRVVLLDAGHLCQTFLLLATALGLAPFCTAALADSVLERDLQLDGIDESVLYACGVGSRPPGVAWAPWPDTTDVPRLEPPRCVKRR